MERIFTPSTGFSCECISKITCRRHDNQTDGVPRRAALGKWMLVFRRAAPRNLLGAGTQAGLVIQAWRDLKGSPYMPKHVGKLNRHLDAFTKKGSRGECGFTGSVRGPQSPAARPEAH